MHKFMESIKKATKGVVDTGAKQMLKTDILFLDREIKARKQIFGIEIYDMMELVESDDTLSAADKEAKIRAIFDSARKDIAVIRAKKDCKVEEMAVLDAEADAAAIDTVHDEIIPNTATSPTSQTAM